ncbi:hypothetical protein GQ55_6G274800 [Panicum hallii var. hallii]|uniref:Uncharacterized protein n=1 Tax=Panicum hallii var. hallii TaxID=1504633 RepID=A0A2T7DA86_9POAL|nr:hypothetical protein GQ55_6G274800 [Panicum hallii var. hallii]
MLRYAQDGTGDVWLRHLRRRSSGSFSSVAGRPATAPLRSKCFRIGKAQRSLTGGPEQSSWSLELSSTRRHSAVSSVRGSSGTSPPPSSSPASCASKA